MNKKYQLQFAHRCAVLLESGISLTETLDIIIRMEKSRTRLTVLSALKLHVEKGISLSKSLILAKAKFDPMLASMISYGESSGILALSLKQASEMMEKGGDIRKKIIGALIYPGFIAAATAGMTLFLVMYIFPKIIPLFSTMNIKLPLLTRAVRKLYELVLHFGLIGSMCAVCIVGIFCYLYFYKRNRLLRTKVQKAVLAAPILGITLQKYSICISSRSAATLLDCGQSLPKIIEHLAISSTIHLYEQAWKSVQLQVERGISLSDSLTSFPLIFPTLVPDMLRIGERTGSLASMFHHIAHIYEQELENFIKQLSTSIEPILMIAMGLIVGSVALSIILPIYEITNHLSK